MKDSRRVDIVNVNFFDWNGDKLFKGGAERYVVELANLLRTMGGSPRILQNAHRPFEREHAGIPVIGIAATDSMDFAAMSAAFREAVRDAALVIASPFELAYGLDSAAPVIGINHGIDWDSPENRFENHDHAIERWVVDSVRACSVCVCVDTNFYNWLRCLDGSAASRLRFVPNFVDLEAFTPVEKRFDDDRLNILFPRRLCVERGFHDAIEALDDLLPRHPELHVHLCGAGGEEDQAVARAFIGRHGYRARWTEFDMHQMRSAYAESHIVLVPTVSGEGTSLACIEAMATNNALVTTLVGGLPNLVIDGYNGIVIEPRPHEIVSAIERLVVDRGLIARLARNAIDVAPAFSRERWMSRWHELLRATAPALFSEVDLDIDLYRDPAWAYGFDAERLRMSDELVRTGDELVRMGDELVRMGDELVRMGDEHDALIAELDAARLEIQAMSDARTHSEQRLMWAESELRGIKDSTGWALLQLLYRIRFALFPRGSRREAFGRLVMRRARALIASWRARDIRTSVSAPATVEATASQPATTAAPVHARPTIATAYAILCLPILEWSFRFQRPQQLARRFARAGHEVLFARHSFGDGLSPRSIEPGIEEIELPGVAGTNPYRDRLDDADAERMADAVLGHIARRGLGRLVCMVQLPFWAPLAFAVRARTGCDIVYDCMDLHAGFSSNTGEALRDEERLLAESDIVACSSPQLVEHAAPHARRTVLIRNGVDYEHFVTVADRATPSSEAPTIGYYGAIADWFDSALVAGIARLRPQWRVVLIGSTWSADTGPLEQLPNIELLGEKPYAELPALIADWDCCLIPFRHTPLTDATNPVKVYEMLAAGKPVVSVRLPELMPMAEAGLVALAEGPEACVAAIEAEIAANTATAIAARRAYAAANTWQMRAASFEQAVDELRPLVSIIVVTFGNRELNELCVESVLNDTDYPSIELIVVDNASKDGTPDLLRALAKRDPRVSIILNDDNKGFSAANNQGAAIARGRYLCFLNNDTVVHGGWLAALVGHLRRHAHLGLVGPVTNAIANEAKVAVGYQDLSGMPAWADTYCSQHRGDLRDISMLAFFCVVVPRYVWQRVGQLDERFGAGMFEDDDYNRRVRAAGFDVRVAHDAFVHHWQMASFKLLGDDEYLRIYRENQARYATKWRESAPPAVDPLAGLKRRAATAPGTVIFAPSVGWAIPLAQRPHHLARALAQDGYVVVFDCSNSSEPIDTLREVEPGLFLYRGAAERLNDLPRLTLWTFSYNYDYRDAFPADAAVIYDWIDDLSVFPYDQRKLAALHARAMRDATVVLSVARRLHARAIAQRDDARYLPNAVEEGRFEREPDPNPALADPVFASILSAGRPIVGYYGALANWFDYALLAQVARRRPDWSFVLIGPDHDGSLVRAKFDRVANVHWLGPKPYTTLPGYLHRFDVAMIPFALNEITLATSPLKLFEYFAAARPVVSTAMPECAAFDVVRVVHDALEFSAALDAARLQAKDPDFRRRLVAIASANTWRVRAREAMAAVSQAREGFADPPSGSGPTRVELTAAANDSSQVGGDSTAALRQAEGDVALLVEDAGSQPPVSERKRAAQEAIMRRFAHLETPANRRFFSALALHLADSVDDPCLPMHFEFSLSSNERGRNAVALLDAITPLAGKEALDVGCACGGFLVALEERGANVVGFDIDGSLLALAEHNFADAGRNCVARRADVMRAEDVAPFAESFDVITCNDVIEHVKDPGVAIAHIASMLRPGGLAYFEIPNRDAPEAVLADGHYQLFGITQLDREAAGRYYAEHAPGVPYGVEHYLRLPEYRRLFEAAGLSMSVLPEPAMRSVDAIRDLLRDVRNALPKKLSGVPAGVRIAVRESVAGYLDEAERHPCGTPDAQSDFVLRYGPGFWRLVARKRGIPAQRCEADRMGEPRLPGALAHKSVLRGTCNVCGKPARFFRDDPSLDRESLACEHCGSISRYRSIARGILEAIERRIGIRAESIAGLPETASARMAIFETQPPFRVDNCGYPIPDLLRRCRWIDLTVSSFHPDRAPGDVLAPGVVNQNLERLTFADGTFDLVITSDVMEHVRLDDRAHAEIARVLKPGGVYIFTVPHFRERYETLVRVCVHDPDDRSSDEHLAPPEYHGDANAPGQWGALAYRLYGRKLLDDLRRIGFDVTYRCDDDDEHGIANAELFHCVKRGEPR